MSIDIFSYGPHLTSGFPVQTIFYKLNLPASRLLGLLLSRVPYLATNESGAGPGAGPIRALDCRPLDSGQGRNISRWITPSQSGHKITRAEILSHIETL